MRAGQSPLGAGTDADREDSATVDLELDLGQLLSLVFVETSGDGNGSLHCDSLAIGVPASWRQHASSSLVHVLVGLIKSIGQRTSETCLNTVYWKTTNLVISDTEQEVGVRVLIDDSLDNLSLVDRQDTALDVLLADHDWKCV